MLKVPQGFADLLPEKAEVFYFVKEKLVSIFQGYGFIPLVPPSIELLETFSLSGEDETNTFNFIDHVETKTACFRYDFTPQVARVVANQNFNLPLKIFYDGVVLRNPKRLSGENREIYQAGVEIVGDTTYFADLELVVLADSVFRATGVKDFKIFLSDVGILKSLFSGMSGVNSISEELKQAFIEKNVSEIAKLAAKLNLSEDKRTLLSDLPLLCGDIKMIKELKNCCKVEEVKPFLKKLEKIANQAEELGITVLFDLGEVKGFEYHSGIILDCYAADSFNKYHEVITGGRYDNLLERYLGKKVSATGFAVDVLKLSSVVSYEMPLRLLIVCSDVNRSLEAFKVADNLRKVGVRTMVVQKNDSPYEKFIKDFPFALILEKDKARFVDFKSNKERTIKKLSIDFANNFVRDMLK